MTGNNLLRVLSQQLQLNSVGHRQRGKNWEGGLLGRGGSWWWGEERVIEGGKTTEVPYIHI